MSETMDLSRAPFADQILDRARHELLGRSHDTFNIDHVMAFAASLDTAAYVADHAANAARFGHTHDLLRAGLDRAPREGLVLEFGVASGGTLRVIADHWQKPVFGFDSFEGLPEEWRPGFPAGMFAQNPPNIPENASLVRGWFNQSLPDFARTHPGDIAFLHIDCDLYSSTRTIFEIIGHRVKPGTVIVFDEYWNYPGWRIHEFKAFQEFLAWSKLNYSFFGFVPSHQQVGVLIA
jgi:hypothetical protein